MENAYDGAKRKGGTSMKRDEVLALLRGYRAELEEYGVKSLAIFGSIARNEDTAQSDVDILVEFNRPVGLFEFVRVKNHLEKILHRPVDLVTPEGLKKQLKERILREAIHAA
jgi:predicted nucleotidyltransferase